MTIYKQDTKILRNVSGEIVKQPLIIDIDSSYGVTKDGSNLVSSVKNRGNANQFLALSGDEPTENGNGFEFGGNKQLVLGQTFNYLKSYIFEAWLYLTAYNSYNIFFSVWNNNDVTNTMFFRETQSGQLIHAFRENGAYVGGAANGGTPDPITLNEWNHVLIYGSYNPNVQQSVSTYINGKAHRCTYFLTPITNKSTANTCVSGVWNRTDLKFKGNIKNLKIEYKQVEWLRNNTTSNTVKYTANTQVFTPPTFPNTIL